MLAAATLAMQDLGKASDAARESLVDNAGFVVRAWNGVKDTFGNLGRYIGSIGAQLSTAEQLAQAQSAVKTIESHFSPHNVIANLALKQAQAQVATLQAQLAEEQHNQAGFNAGQDLANQAKQAHDKALAEGLAGDSQATSGFVEQAAAINKKRYEALAGIVNKSVIDKVNATYDKQIQDAIKRANASIPRAATAARSGAGHASTTDPFASLNGLV